MRKRLRIFLLLVAAPVLAVARQYPNQCFDFTDLTAPNVVCHFAQAADVDSVITSPINNWPRTGVRTGDPIWENVHHNVIEPGAGIYYNTPASYPIFGDTAFLTNFHQLPEGFERSVRLGNYCNGGSSSNIEYTMQVDTNYNPIIVLRLAPVLEASHALGSGCMFYIKDTAGALLDSVCNTMRFRLEGSTMTGSMPGNPMWKKQDDYFYLDWATLGVDLSPYHDEVITLVFQAWDCSRGQHVGLLYYTIQNFEKEISVYTCGVTEGYVTMSAPEGFFYRWYNTNDPTTILSHDRNIMVPVSISGQYGCDCAMDTGYHCQFTLYANAIAHNPVAQFDYDLHRGLCADTVWVHNTSLNTDSVLWNFGGGKLSDGSTPNPHQYDFDEPIIYSISGDHNIQLIACVRDFECTTDTARVQFHTEVGLGNQIYYDTICQGEAIQLGEQVVVMPYAGDSLVSWQENTACGPIHVNWYIHAKPSYTIAISDTTCHGHAYAWRGNQYTISGVYYDSLVTQEGCDSVYVLNLAVAQRYDPFGDVPNFWDEPYPDPQFPTDTICDTTSYNWHGRILTETGYFQDTLQTRFGCDSVVYLHLVVKECGCPQYTVSDTLVYIHAKDVPYVWHGDSYKTEGDYRKTLQDIQGCDSTAQLRLRILDDCIFIPIISKTRNQ